MRKTEYSQCLEADAPHLKNSKDNDTKAKPYKVIGGYFGDGFAMPPVIVSSNK